MDSMHINETNSMKPGENSDWLDVDEIMQTCTITTEPDMNQTSRQDDSNQDNTDLQPFDPDYQEIAPQKWITNLPKLNECEFDHNYILHHLEQLEIDPTLYSKCYTANKYFASPEPFVQDLYKKSCY